MPLGDYEIVYNGLSIGAGSTVYIIDNIDGLGGTSPLRVQDDNRGYIDGSYTGRDFYDERYVYIDMTILGDENHSAQYYYKELQRAFAPQPLGYYVDPTGQTPVEDELKLFQFQLSADTGPMRMYGRSRGLTTPVTPEFSYGYIKTRIEMVFPDPRYYSDEGTEVTGSSVIVGNDGWATSCPVIQIDIVTAVSGYITDGSMYMNFVNLTIGQPLTVDLLSRVIYVNNYPSRSALSTAYSGWLSIPPNTPVLAWSSTVGDMSVTYRNAYI
jgi:hypothetical protein